MDTATAFTAGFHAALVKAAAAGDNQPGPQPGQPAPPDSHRKRNVALGAGLIAGGLLAARPFLRNQGQMATQLARQARASQGRNLLARQRRGDHVGAEIGRFMSRKGKGPTVGERARALAGHYKEKAKGIAGNYKRDLGNQRFMREHGIRRGDAKRGPAKKGSKWGNRALMAAATPVAIGGAAVAGAAGASKARESQSDDQPGLK